jgi:adhesin/invasin
VQLQDSGGKPARDPSGNVTVHLLSSIPETGNVSSTVTIPYGKTHSTASFFSTYTAGSTTITALTSNYETGQATVTTYVIDQYTLDASATAQPTTISSREQATITIYVAYNGLSPAPGANIQLTSDNGGSFSATTDEGNGSYTSVFTAPTVTAQTVCTILTTASRLGYTSGQASVQVTVNPIILNVSVTAQPDSINSTENATIRVYVAYNGINPASGVTIELTSNNGGSFSATTDEENGSYTSNFTAPTVTAQTVCTILAKASKVGYNSGQETVQVTVNSTIHTGNILLHIKDNNGNALSEANITSTSHPTGISQLSGITGDAGTLGFNGVPEGSYTFQITKSGYYTTNETITVTAGQTTDTTINLTKTPSPLLSTPVLIAIVAIVIIAIVIIVIILRKYRISLSTS